MILNYEGHNPIKIDPGKITVLGTNNRKVYSEFILGLQEYNNKIKFFNDKYEHLETRHAIDWDGNIIENQNLISKYDTEIVNAIFNNLTEEQHSIIDNCEYKLYSEIQKILLSFDLPIEVKYDGDVKKILKQSKIHLNSSISMDPYVIIETDFKIHMECNDSSCIGLSNISNYLGPDQLQDLVLLNKELNTSALIVEFLEFSNKSFYKNCDYYYIDEDFIDWHS